MDSLSFIMQEFATGETMIAFGAGLSAFMMMVIVWSALVSRNPMSRRIKAIMAVRNNLQADNLKPKGNDARRLDAGALSLMSRVVQKLHLLKTTQTEKVSIQLSRAGWRSRNRLVVFLFMKAVLPIFLALGSLAFVTMTPIFPLSIFGKMGVGIVAALVGFYAPDIITKNSITRREQEIQKTLPDALDLLVICAEAGLSLDAALTRTADEIGRSGPELSDELGLTAVELGFLPSRRDALENFMSRCQLQDVRAVVATLSQTEKYGTPLANSLRVLSTEFRSNRMMRAEEKAAKLPATLTIPLVMFILPSLFVVLLGPAILRAIDGFSKM